jgi:hypothetical protein
MPGVGLAFQMMLPIAGIVAAIAVVDRLIEHHEALAKAIAKSAQASVDATIKESDQTKALELTNLKLDDEIAKLEHKPSRNYMAEAVIETSQEIDKLAAAYSTDFQKMDELVMNQTTLWERFKRAMSDAWSGVGQGKGYGTATAGLNHVKDAMSGVEEARRKLAEAPMDKDSQVTAQQNLITALKGQQSALDAVIPMMAGNVDVTLQMKTTAASTATEIKNLNQAIEAGGKRGTVAVLTQQKDAQALANKALEEQIALQRIVLEGMDAHIQAVHKLAQTNAEAVLESQKTPDQSSDDSLKQKLAEIELERNAAIQAANDTLVAKERAYNADSKAAQGNAAKKKELEAAFVNALRANADAIALADAEANAKSVAATAAANAEKITENRKAMQQMADDSLKSALDEAKRKEQAAMTAAKSLEALHRSTNAQTLADEVKATQTETEAEVKAYQNRIAALDKFSKDYEAQVRKLNDEIRAIEQKGADEVTTLKATAAQKQATDIKAAEDKMADAIATDIAKSIVQNKSLAAAFRQTGEQMAEGMIKNLLIAELTGNKQKLIDAKTAAANSYNWASAWGGPVAGAIAGATAFAGVLSYEVGGKIPGSGPVPITGHGGETVVTKALTDRVESSERRGNTGGVGGGLTMHYAPQIHAVDANGVDDMLQKHGAIFQRHITAAVRRMNH